MRRRIRIDTGLAILAAGTLALTGCTRTTSSSPGSTPATATKAPAAELADAADHLKAATFTMTMTVKIDNATARFTGNMDPAHQAGAFTVTTTLDGTQAVQQWRVIGDTVYLKSNTPGLPASTNKPWRRIDATDPGGSLADSLNGATIADSLRHGTAVQRTGTGHYTGTITSSALAGFFNAPSASTGPSAPTAASLTFTADVDGQRRLTRYHLDVPRSNGGTYPIDIDYSNFGTTVSVQPPPADQVADGSGR